MPSLSVRLRCAASFRRWLRHGESCRGLSEAQVARPISFKTRSLETIFGNIDEKCERFADRHCKISWIFLP